MSEEIKTLIEEIKDMRDRATEHQIRSEKFFSVTETKLSAIDDHLKTLNSKVATNVKKIDGLERYRDEATGKIGVLAAIAGMAFSFIGSALLNLWK